MADETEVISELLQTLKAIGPEKVIAVLKNSRLDLPFSDPVLEFVFTSVCSVFSVSRLDLFSTDNISDARKYGLAFIVFYLRQPFGYRMRDLCALFDVHRASIYNWVRLVKNLSSTSKVDQPYLQKKKHLDILVTEFKTTNHV